MRSLFSTTEISIGFCLTGLFSGDYARLGHVAQRPPDDNLCALGVLASEG